MTFSKRILLPALAAGLALAASPSDAAVRIKFATLAPDGTNAMKAMRAIDADIQKATGKQVKFKFYTGGRKGDEKDMVKQIKIGLLHGGGFTGVGLGEIAKEVRVLDAPSLFRTYDEIDLIYDKFAEELERAFDKAGYVLLGWTEVGFIHVFSNSPVRSVADMRKLKIWVWEGDPIAESAFKALGVHPIPLSITDVNTSLQTGHINAIYSSPLYAIALQWHEKTKFVLSTNFANGSGAVVLSKRIYKRLKPDQQKALMTSARKHLRQLTQLTREENLKALETLRKHGHTITKPSPAALKEYEAAGAKARRMLTGRLYPKELLDRVEGALAEHRKKPAPKKPKTKKKK